MRDLTVNERGYVQQRESTTLEYKKLFTFDKEFFHKCLRTIAGFANNQGGMLVFGVKNRPHELIGIDGIFLQAHEDNKTLSEKINLFFAPVIQFETEIRTLNEKLIGIIYVQEARHKPIICKRQGEQDILREAAVYFRYQAETKEIQFADLFMMLEREKDKERKQWFALVERTAKIGVDNVGLLDLRTGAVSGTSGSFLIDESLLPKLRFIQDGHFSETDGEPTLKLIGEVQSMSTALTIEKHIAVPVSNAGHFKPKQVIEQVNERLELGGITRRLTQHIHQQCWKKYQVRPSSKSEAPEQTEFEYCIYDEPYNGYLYTPKWIEFLIEKMSNDDEYESIISTNTVVSNDEPAPPEANTESSNNA